MNVSSDHAVLAWADIVAPGEAFHVNSLELAKSRAFALHGHLDFAELFIVERGKGLHLVNGLELALGERDLVLVRPGDFHGFAARRDESFRWVNLAFPIATLDFLRTRHYRDNPGFWGGEEAEPALFRLGSEVADRLVSGLRDLSHGPRNGIRIEAFLLWAASLVMPPLPQGDALRSAEATGASCPGWLERALAGLEDAGTLRRGLEGFFAMTGRSPEHVARECRRVLGLTPTALVNEARLRRAAWLLDMSGEEVLSICLDCGFESPSHFHRLFKARYGMSPRRFRLERQGRIAPPTGTRALDRPGGLG